MALIDGATAHAFPGLPGAGLMLDAIHVAAMGIWVGGLAAFLVAPDRRFARYAGGAIAVSLASGLVLALAHLGSPAALVTTATDGRWPSRSRWSAPRWRWHCSVATESSRGS